MSDERTQVTGPEDLDADRLLVTAAAAAGLDDYGDESFVEPMTRWLSSIRAEGDLTPIGAMGMQAETVRLLVNRLRFEDDLKRHPEILDEDVSDPVVILGLLRTGSTKFLRLMAADPGVQKLPYWRALNPAPFPGADPNGPDPRLEVARAQIALEGQDPEVAAAHPLSVEEAEEEFFLLEMTFESLAQFWFARCPSYIQWWQAQPRERPYKYLHRLVQYCQWQDGGRRGRPWVLKTPAHTGNPDVVLGTFPNATLVQCHRDPTVALASSLRLQETTRRALSADVDLHELGEVQLAYFAGEMARNLEQRELIGKDHEIIDVDFSAICDDPIGAIREIYERQGRELSPGAEACMVEWDRNNPQHKQGKFVYSLEDYGLTRKHIEAAFGPYFERFGSGWQSS